MNQTPFLSRELYIKNTTSPEFACIRHLSIEEAGSWFDMCVEECRALGWVHDGDCNGQPGVCLLCSLSRGLGGGINDLLLIEKKEAPPWIASA